MDMYQDIINTLASNEYYHLKKDINKLVNDSTFIQRIVKIHNPIVFDRFIKMCEFKIDTTPLYEERRKFIKNSLYHLTLSNVCEFFEVDDIELAKKYIDEYIVTFYFSDNYYNFMTNLYQMTNYLSVAKKKHLVSDLNLDLYKEFVELRNMSFIDKLLFFKLLLDDNLNLLERFYDDIFNTREDSHKELVNSVIKLNHDSNLYKKDISNNLGVDVYLLNGEKFYGFLRNISIPSSDLSKPDYVNSKGKRLGHSFTFFGDTNISSSGTDGVKLFYDNIDYKKIMYVYHADAHTKKMNKLNDYLSEKENEILLPASLLAKTRSYNEVYIKGGIEGIKPTALICYDTITNDDILFAKTFNLSILVINTSKYPPINYEDEDYNINTYVI